MSKKNSRTKLLIEQLQPGIFIEIPGKWSAHPFIFNKFRLASQQQIEILTSCGIGFVYADLAKSTAAPLTITDEQPLCVVAPDDELSDHIQRLQQQKQAKIEAMQRYRRTLKKCQESYKSALAQVRSLSNKLQSRPLESVAQAHELISELACALLEEDDLVLHLVSDDRDDHDLHHHSLSVCVLSLLVGKYIGLDSKAMTELGLAGLLHDIGKLKIPAQLYSNKTIGNEQRNHIIRQHPAYALEILKLCPSINENIKSAIAQHHEFADGSGYPNKLTRAQLDDSSLIVSLVNYYEKLRFPYNNDKAKSPAQALSYLFKHHRERFDPVHLAAFIKTMGVYPPGTFVALSNEQVGIVITVTSSNLLAPLVMVFDETVPRNDAAIIDIATEDISIEKAISLENVAPEARQYLCPIAKTSIYIGI